MTKNAVFIQGCIVIFAVFICYVRAQDMERKKRAEVNCERQPYHYTCRGKMSRKRAMATRLMHELDCEDTDQDFGCIKLKLPGEKHYYSHRGPLSESKLWSALLNNHLERNGRLDGDNSLVQEVRHETNSENRAAVYDRRRIPTLGTLLSRLESMENTEEAGDTDVDY